MMNRLTLAVVLFVVLLSAGTARAECTTCDDDPFTWDDPASTEDAPMFTCGTARPFLDAIFLIDGLLIVTLLVVFAMRSKDAQPGGRRYAFRFGLLPGIGFLLLSLFFGGIAHIVGWSFAVVTSGFGLLLGAIFAIYMAYVLCE